MRGSSEVYFSRNKKFCNDFKDGDLISDLPECVLSRILSFLPTKDAVRTSVLSKVWEYRWTLVYNVKVDDRVRFSRQIYDVASFIKFMDRILILIKNIKSVDLFCGCEWYDRSRMETWACALFRHNVEIVRLRDTARHDDFLYIRRKDTSRDVSLVLPRSLLCCASLRELLINMSCTWKVPVKICFPSLTSLYLEAVQILNDNSSTDTLTFTFPVLAKLVLKGCRWLKVRFVELYAPRLRSFYSFPIFHGRDDDYLIKISGATLDEFECFGYNVENFVLCGSRVLFASLDILMGYGEWQVARVGLRTRKLLNELSTINRLTVSCFQAQVIAQTKSGPPLPKFNYLAELTLYRGNQLINYPIYVEALIELLHAAPSLKNLIVHMLIFSLLDTLENGFDYDALASVPSCIVSHLESVKFVGFRTLAPQLSLAKFLLQHAAKLNVMSFPNCLTKSDEVLEVVPRFPRASASVTFDIKYKVE